MKKVLFVATVVKKHINVFHLPTLKLFQDNGWETSVCARNDFDSNETCNVPYCDHYYDIPFERSPFKTQNIACYKEVKRLIEKEKYDIVYCHTPVGAMIARLAARKARKQYGTRVIYMAHGFHFFTGAPLLNWIIFYPAEKWLSRFTDTLITINKEDYNRALKFHAKEVKYVPGVGINLDKFYSDEEIKLNKRKELGIADDEIALLSVGELTKRKNQMEIIEAMHNLNNPKLKYFVCGNGQNEQLYKDKINEYHLENQIFLLGFRRDIVDICNACDLFVFPSLQEGLPVALMEAMACGMPVVCSDIRGNADLIQDHNGGFLVKLGEEKFEDKIQLCLKEDLKEMSSRNLKEIRKYDIHVILDYMKDIFNI